MPDFKLQVGVKILLKNKEGKFLLVHRSKDKYPEVESPWDIVGGRINPGETLKVNLEREVKEETNLTLIGEPKIVSSQDILRDDNVHIVRLTYLGGADGSVILDEENNDYKWLSWEEIKALDNSLNKYFRAVLPDIESCL